MKRESEVEARNQKPEEFRSMQINSVSLLLLASGFLAFTFGIFGPLESYIININELWFSIADLWWMTIICGAVIFVVCVSIGLLFRGKGRDIVICIIFGVALGLYIQGNFINTNYGVLDGREIIWDDYTKVAIINTIVWLICIALPFGLRWWNLGLWYKVLKYASLLVLAVQVVTLSTLLLTAGLATDSKYKQAYLSVAGINEVSTEKNVVIFVLDTFDDVYFKELLQEDSEFLAELDGFTYFNNMTGMYPTTKGALPYLLTGQQYRNEQPYKEYIQEAYSNTDYYTTLVKNGFSIGIYTGKPMFLAVNECEGLVINLELVALRVSSSTGLMKTMYKFTAFRYLPHVVKRYAWFYSGEFDSFKTSSSTETHNEVFTTNNLGYYRQLVQNRLSLVNNGNCYRFIHLDGVHLPYSLNEDLEEVAVGADHMTQSRAVLCIVYEYINQLKELDVYDNTLIIITGDHGETGGPYPTNPMLLVKPLGVRGTLVVSNAPVSHSDFGATVMTELGLNEERAYGTSVLHVEEGEDRERSFLYYSWDDSWSANYLPEMVEYRIDSHSNNLTSFNRDNVAYKLGTELSFLRQETLKKYSYYGFSYNEKTHTWSDGHSAKMAFKLIDVPRSDLSVNMAFLAVFNDSQRFITKVNDEILFDKIITEPGSVEFTVPQELVDGTNLVLNFEFPDAVSSRELGTGNGDRDLAFAFTSMQISQLN